MRGREKEKREEEVKEGARRRGDIERRWKEEMERREGERRGRNDRERRGKGGRKQREVKQVHVHDHNTLTHYHLSYFCDEHSPPIPTTHTQ